MPSVCRQLAVSAGVGLIFAVITFFTVLAVL